MNLALFGPPGSGKGTQSILLRDRAGFSHVSTGDLLRAERKAGTELGHRVADIMKQGDLVPDEIVDELVRKRAAKLLENSTGIVFDGYPRTLAQAQTLEATLRGLNSDLHLAVSLDIEDQELILRLTNRRICEKCKRVYNLISNPPAKTNICDDCKTGLVQRLDDRPEAIAHRLEEYHAQTEPILRYLEDQGKLRRIDADQSIQQVHDRLMRNVRDGRDEVGALS